MNLRDRLQLSHDRHLATLRELCEMRNHLDKPRGLVRWLRRRVREEVSLVRGFRADLAEIDNTWKHGEISGLCAAVTITMNHPRSYREMRKALDALVERRRKELWGKP